MKIVGCDLHAKQQTIAMVDTETGEFTEKTLAHEGNKVREFYAALEGPVVVGIEATGAMQWFSTIAGRARDRVPGGTSGEDPGQRDWEAETRSAGCAARARAAHGGSLPDHLDAVDGAAGPANVAAGPSSVGEDANASAEHVAGDRSQSRAAARANSVECSWAESTPGLGSVSLHESTAGRTAAFVGAVAEADPGTRPAGGRRSQAASPGAAGSHASGRGPGDGAGDRGVSRGPDSIHPWQESS